jgi:endonuclease/exonuclease/phosphatase family metal-dependent hydrolase
MVREFYHKVLRRPRRLPGHSRVGLCLEQLESRCLLAAPSVTVMSYNLFQGSELTQALTATSIPGLFAAASAIEAQVAATDIPGRAQAWANEVAAAGPDVLALQEASLWRTQSPSSTLTTGHQTPATTVQYDFIATLIDDLAVKGLHYTVVGTVNGLDIQSPDLAGNEIRLTDRVAILARADEPPGQLRWTNVQSADYQARFTGQVGGSEGPSIVDLNGWVSADFTKRGETFRVVTTHLDALIPSVNALQAQELLAGPANTNLPVIVMGDLNSPADASGSSSLYFLAAGFQDTWAATHPGDPGYTCCQSEFLNNPTSQLNERIDYIFSRGGFRPDSMSILGASAADKTASGLWPSDHASITATLGLTDLGHHGRAATAELSHAQLGGPNSIIAALIGAAAQAASNVQPTKATSSSTLHAPASLSPMTDLLWTTLAGQQQSSSAGALAEHWEAGVLDIKAAIEVGTFPAVDGWFAI